MAAFKSAAEARLPDRGPNRESVTQSENEIMARLRDGDEAALADLIDRYWKRLVKYAVGYLSDLDAAEDIVQEAFVRIWKSRSNWAPSGTPRAYVYRIVRNLALQENEKRVVRRRFRQSTNLTENPLTPAEELERKRLRLTLEPAVAALAPRRREVLVLARFHGLSYAQIAEVMGISAQTVANQMSAALRDLRKSLGSGD